MWAADMTACRLQHGWCYLAVVLDLASRRVLGWAVERTPRRRSRAYPDMGACCIMPTVAFSTPTTAFAPYSPATGSRRA